MIYQYFNINPIRIINQEILLLTGPKKWEADIPICNFHRFSLIKKNKIYIF